MAAFERLHPEPGRITAIRSWAAEVDLDEFVRLAVRSVDPDRPEDRLRPIPEAAVVAWFLAYEGTDSVVFVKQFSVY